MATAMGFVPRTVNLNLTYIEVINAAYSTLNSLEKRIADFILKNGTACQHLSARELADRGECSGATVVRFSRKLNYGGFTDLKYHIRSAGNKLQDDITLSAEEKAASMKQKALMYATSSLQTTVGNVDEQVWTGPPGIF